MNKIFKTATTADTKEFEDRVLDARDNGFEYIQSVETLDIYKITDQRTILLTPEEHMVLLSKDYPDGVPAELLSEAVLKSFIDTEEEVIEQVLNDMFSKEEAGAVMPKDKANLLLIDDIINNTLKQDKFLQPQQADTLQKLATVKAILAGINNG